MRPKYLLIADSAFSAMQIEEEYAKKRFLLNFDLDIAFSGCHISQPNKNFIIVDPYMREIKDVAPRYRWYMPKDAIVEVDVQYGNRMFEAVQKLKALSKNPYNAVVNACEPTPCGFAEFWYSSIT